MVHLKIPASHQEFDMFIPTEMSVYKAATLIGQALEKMTNGIYCFSNHEILCCPSRGYILHPTHKIKEYGFSRGEELILL